MPASERSSKEWLRPTGQRIPFPLLANGAVRVLLGAPELRQTSRRLLADLIEVLGVRRVTPATGVAEADLPSHDFLALVVVQGKVHAAPSPRLAAARRRPPARFAPSHLHPVYWHDHPAVSPMAEAAVLRAAPDGTAARDETADLVVLDRQTISKVVELSPTLMHSGRMHERIVRFLRADRGRNAKRGSVEEGVSSSREITRLLDFNPEFVWVAKASDVTLPVEALAQLLVAGVGGQFPEPAALVTLEGGAGPLDVWTGSQFVRVARSVGGTVEAATALKAHARVDGLHRLYFAHPANPVAVPAGFVHDRFHRVVYVTQQAPTRIPEDLAAILKDPEARFSSFISSVLLTKRRRARRSILGWVGSVVSRALGVGFETEDIDGFGRRNGAPLTPERRLRRDLCRLGFDVGGIRGAWTQAVNHPSFPVRAEDAAPGTTQTARRWGRAVTNRRIGFALSGGGACSFRVVPLIRQIEATVPIDVFSGISGGALLGAYFARYGDKGLELAQDLGPWFRVVTSAAILSTWFVQAQVDADLGDARLEESEVRFLPVTTALTDPPTPRAVLAGTFGEGVRVSGSLPVGWGPTRKGLTWRGFTHWADGSTATLVPGKILTDYGADITIACNCIPGPARGNPFDRWPLGRFAYDWTPLGRFIDGWICTAFILQEASRVAGVDADVFWEPSSQRIPLFEAPAFECARRIVEESRKHDSKDIERAANQLLEAWKRLGTTPP